MTLIRKLEVISGVTTSLMGIAIPVWLLRIDFEIAQRINADYSEIFLELLGVMLFFVIPGLLIGIGSYIHAIRQRSQGSVMIIVGNLLLVINFLGVFFTSGYQVVSVIEARFFLMAMGIATLITSFIVRDRN